VNIEHETDACLITVRPLTGGDLELPSCRYVLTQTLAVALLDSLPYLPKVVSFSLENRLEDLLELAHGNVGFLDPDFLLNGVRRAVFH
jgi:hypothetical protein